MHSPSGPDRRKFLFQTAGALAGFALAPELGAAMPDLRGRQTRVAVVGVGRQGRALLAELLKIDGVEIAAVCDTIASRLEAGRERAPGAAGFADHRALLERSDIEAVLIATPTHLHREVVIDALAAGKHVYCEAPLASTIQDCEAIVSAAAAAPGIFHAGLQARSNPIYRRAWSLVRAGSLRDLASLQAQHNRKTTWRTPSPEPALEKALNWRLDPEVSIGMAGELGTHQFDVMQWFRGSDPVRIDGRGSVRAHKDGRALADTIDLRLTWDDGLVLGYSATLASSYGGQYEVLHGSNAAVRLAWTHGWLFKEADAPTEGWEVYATRQQFYSDEGITLVADATRLAAQGRLKEGEGLEHPPLHYALADFVRSFVDGAPVACSAEDAMRATVVGILADRAVRDGGEIRVPARG